MTENTSKREKTKLLKVYERNVIEGEYPNGLAYSVHMSLIENDENGENNGMEEPLHNQYGLLFPKAAINENNVIVPKFVGRLRIAAVEQNKKEQYIITGENLLENGEPDPQSSGLFWSWSTFDFQTFEEWGLITRQEVEAKTKTAIHVLRESDCVKIPSQMADKMKQKWNPLRFQSVTKLTESDGKESQNSVRVQYSDGSFHEKNLSVYPNLKFPLARGFGDPVILLWKDEYYYIATNDNLDDIGFYVRKAHTLDELFSETVSMHLILDRDESRQLIQTFWAPEFHRIGENLYLLFAVSGQKWGPQCHLMKLKENGDILKAEDWEDPVRIKKADGSFLTEQGITLDMTYVKSGDRHFYIWSYRENIRTPLDSGSMLMVAEFSPNEPDRLITEPVCLSRPLYGFENTSGTINNEGPYAFYHNGTIYLAYSGGHARGYLYTIGILTAKDGADLCDLSVWEKAKTPAVSFASVPGEYGPGHNSFFCDRNNDWWIAFHAVQSFGESVISSAIRRVHFDVEGNPRFDLAREEDLPEIYRKN